MKKTVYILATLLLATACYDDYVRDYDYSAVFAAYQYDLRSFVLGEDEAFKFQVALGGVMDNKEDRRVEVSVDDALLEGAVAGMKNKSLSSGDYVGNAITEAGITAFKPLPSDCYSLDGIDDLVIRKGSHTAAIKVSVAPKFTEDPEAFKPLYAIGFRINRADADTVLQAKNYEVIAVKCENRFFGYWSRGGVLRSYDWAGNQVGEPERETASLADSRTYELTTRSANVVSSNKVAGSTGQMTLTFDGDAISITSDDGKISGTGSFSGDVLLQNRQLYLKYRIEREGGAYDEVLDTLSFRNRIRDGISEWQDENPEHYN